MRSMLDRCTLLAGASLFLLLGGCGPKVTRNADVSSGDYYSAEEFKRLDKKQREAYCAALEAELASLESRQVENGDKAAAARARLAAMQSELEGLEGRYASAKSEGEALNQEIGWYENLPKSYLVVKGDFLQKISGMETIYNDPTKWTRIYFANREKLLEQGPNWIYPGWELAIPRDWPSSWTVSQDEYLGRIAGYWEVYDDATKWVRIYEANKDRVRDPDVIWPGWELQIPRD